VNLLEVYCKKRKKSKKKILFTKNGGVRRSGYTYRGGYTYRAGCRFQTYLNPNLSDSEPVLISYLSYSEPI
jgi:hypothetical protein